VVPGAALLVTGALYVVGIGRDGRDVIGNVISLVRLDSRGDFAHQYLVAGFFAPTHSRLEIAVPGETAVRPAGKWDAPPPANGAGGQSSSIVQPATVQPAVRIDQGRDTRVTFNSNQWSMRTVTLERTLDAGVGSITYRLRSEGATIRGTIRNDTPYLLEDAAVVVGDGVNRLERLGPGESASVDLTYSSPPPSRRAGSPLSWRVLSGPPHQPGGAPTVDAPKGAEAQRRSRVLALILDDDRTGAGVPGTTTIPLTFLAFTRTPIGVDFPRVGDRPTYHLTLIEQRLRTTPS
jgi:hypothetical protein